MSRIRFKINGEEYSVGEEVSSDVMLVDYLRNYLELRGTKFMCRRAGCGACIVAASKTPGAPPLAVNSCMVSITSCQDWDITTIEEIGNRKKGYNPIQETLAKCNGSQCGYCSPGWVMAMYSLLRNKKNLTMKEIEKSFGSNVCRCTGYRSILEAFKHFAVDAPTSSIDLIPDIEDLNICKKNNKPCTNSCDDDWCVVEKLDIIEQNIKEIHLKDDKKWFRPTTINEILSILKEEKKSSYQLVAGNTAKGVYPIKEYPHVLIDVSAIAELKGHFIDQNLVIKAGTTLSELVDIFNVVRQQEEFNYLNVFKKHLELVAHIAVRNIGTIAGNLMIKHQHNEFPSDIYLLLSTVGAEVTIITISGEQQQFKMRKFLTVDMKDCVILNVMLPPLSKNYRIYTIKVTPRAQNAHATVNAGFLYKLTADCTVEKARIVYGNLSPNFNRATDTEKYLKGKKLFTNDVLQSALKVLSTELVVEDMPLEFSATYRRKLALGLFYKGLLYLCPRKKICKKYQSGALKIRENRPVSEGQQFINTDPKLWPLNEPIPKLEALIQCAGESEYTDDVPSCPHEVFGSFVLSTIPKGDIVLIDPSKALKHPGVIAFYTAEDIPGLNSFTPADHPSYRVNEEVLSSGKISYYNQPLGIIVAKTRYIADFASQLVDVTYSNVEKPVIDVQIAKKDPARVKLDYESKADEIGKDVYKVLKGSNTIYGQYFFMMESLSCVTKPSEEGFEVHATCQWLDAMQLMISRALKVDCNRIDIYVRRLGGSYGIKINRSIQVAVACSLVAQKLNRPCRFIQSMETTARAVGKRFPNSSDYEIGVNNSGVIQYCNYNLNEDNGYVINGKVSSFAIDVFNNVYNSSVWNFKLLNVVTDTPRNTFFRAPGHFEAIYHSEHFLERISYELSLDPIQVRLANLDPAYSEIIEMIDRIKKEGEYNERKSEVAKFNSENRWRKRGLGFSLFRYKNVEGRYFDVNMSVYHGDGTVSITFGGIEIGQGINTKAAQVAAYKLNIPVDKIQIKPSNTITSPNSEVTGGSLTCQYIIIGVTKCCEELLKNLEPIRNKLKSPTWEDLIAEAYKSSVDLQTHGFVNKDDMQSYQLFGVALAEVEVDVLTGVYEILRVDLLQDVGVSINPSIDIGQVEGAFVMGLGYWTCEKLVYNNNTGQILTDNSWDYYVPQANDIPQDFRVYFRNNSYSTKAIYGSKSIGEPPICLSVVIPFALRAAVVAARTESGIPSTAWFPIDGPYTIATVGLACETRSEDFKYN